MRSLQGGHVRDDRGQAPIEHTFADAPFPGMQHSLDAGFLGRSIGMADHHVFTDGHRDKDHVHGQIFSDKTQHVPDALAQQIARWLGVRIDD